MNNHRTLPKTLRSVRDQEIKVFETIIVDDCSDNQEHLLEIIQEFKKDISIKLLRNETNKNGAYSRNRGILESKGEVVAFLDSDDQWLEKKTVKIVEYVKKHGLEAIYFSKAKIAVKDKIIDSRPKRFFAERHMSEYLFLDDGFIQTSTIFCGRLLASRLLFNEKFIRHQDYDFVLRAYSEGFKFVFIANDLVIYNASPTIRKQKGEASTYSIEWLKLMAPHFTNQGALGFKLFNITARLISERQLVRATLNSMQVLLKMNIKTLFRIRHKFYRIIHLKI